MRAVRDECSAVPLLMGNCHCRDCQRATGSAYAPAIGVAAQALKISGEVKYYENRADNGNVASRGFCPICGARLFSKSAGMPLVVEIYAGTLDDPARFKPQADIYTTSAQPWDPINPELPKFPKMPWSAS